MQDVKQVSAAQLHQMMQDDVSLTLIDVREVYEHDSFNIGGKLIVLSEIMYHLQEIPKEGVVIIYCRKGVRSAIAIQKLQERHGYNNLQNLEGGVEEWIRWHNNANLFA